MVRPARTARARTSGLGRGQTGCRHSQALRRHRGPVVSARNTLEAKAQRRAERTARKTAFEANYTPPTRGRHVDQKKRSKHAGTFLDSNGERVTWHTTKPLPWAKRAARRAANRCARTARRANR